MIGVAAAVPSPVHAQDPLRQGAIRGQILDETTGQGIPAVQVEFMDGRTRIRATTTSDQDGLFTLGRVPAGPFRLRVNRIGYARTTTPYWRVEPGEVLSVTVRLHPEAVLLAPLEITARARSQSPVLEGFYHRADRGIGGHFFTREEIERRNASRVTDMLASVPGVHLTTAPGFGAGSRLVSMARTLPGRGGGGCPVQVFVDGVLATRRRLTAGGGGLGNVDGVPVDDLVSAASVEGIEVYRGLSSVPAEFLTPDARCGVIAIWTRRGG